MPICAPPEPHRNWLVLSMTTSSSVYTEVKNLTINDRSRFWTKVHLASTAECWLWTSFIENGYGMFWLDGRSQRASRVSWSLSNDRDIPDGLWVLHRCDVRACVNPKHLFLGTHQDNMRDMREKGRAVCPSRDHPELQARGEDAGLAKLTNHGVRRIRVLAEQGLSQRTIGARYGVTHNTIGAILRGKTWRHV